VPFDFKRLDIKDLIVIIPKIFPDSRGLFFESYKKSDFIKNDINVDFNQDNHSISQLGVLRGLHYQLEPMSQGKLVRVVKGKVWDVAIDIRKKSPTFLQWRGIELSENNHIMFYIPPGFAHGFITLEDDTHFLYKCTNEYSSANEGGIIWNDPEINIKWPIDNPKVSDKDLKLPYLKDAKIFN